MTNIVHRRFRKTNSISMSVGQGFSSFVVNIVLSISLHHYLNRCPFALNRNIHKSGLNLLTCISLFPNSWMDAFIGLLTMALDLWSEGMKNIWVSRSHWPLEHCFSRTLVIAKCFFSVFVFFLYYLISVYWNFESSN